MTTLCADEHSVSFVVEKNLGVYKKIIDLSREKIAQSNTKIVSSQIISPADLLTKSTAESKRELITIGTRSAKATYQLIKENSTTSTLLTESAFESLAKDYFGSIDNALASNVSPILLNQPFYRFLALGNQLVPEAKTVGILLGPAGTHKEAKIRELATKRGLTVIIAHITPESNPIKVIDPVMKASDFFIVIPDQQLINRSAAKWVLQLSFRYKKPVVAYSKKYVQAGALAAVYSSPEDIAQQIADVVTEHYKNPSTTGKVYYPDYFSIEINTSVARSLKIETESEDFYTEQLQQHGEGHP